MCQRSQLADDSRCEQEQQSAVDDDAEGDDYRESSRGWDTGMNESEARRGHSGCHAHPETYDQQFASHKPGRTAERPAGDVRLDRRQMNRVMANDAATPTTPQCKPMTNPSNVTGVENRRKRNITPGRPMAWVVAQLSVCRVVPTPARLSHCNTGTAAPTSDRGRRAQSRARRPPCPETRERSPQ